MLVEGDVTCEWSPRLDLGEVPVSESTAIVRGLGLCPGEDSKGFRVLFRSMVLISFVLLDS